jgi:hypothetical protein
MVETVERLKLLTLLTYADISAVNPAAMTPWRSEHLWQLYLGVYNELTRALETDRIEPTPTGSPERVAFLAGLSQTLPAHPHRSRNRRTHGAQAKAQPPDRRRRGYSQARFGLAVDADRADRPACSPAWRERSPASA